MSGMNDLNKNLYLISILKNGLGLAGWCFLLRIVPVAIYLVPMT